ncbi:MAG: uracil-DNA glycosylase family protein [Spirochaetales bacterium]|nr:uracil-DNA glycosylase family protein [Spirochaetales bacterium]
MQQLLDRIARESQKGEMAIDFDAYRRAGRDPASPVLLGSGSLRAPIGIFGRDPGRTEIAVGEPFVGKGGQLVRTALHRAAGGVGTPPFEQSIEAGRRVFWGNTVPYKPVGNKAWSTKVKRRFVPFITELLVEHWTGDRLITLGNQAFEWFALADASLKSRLVAFWRREDRYESSIEVMLYGKTMQLYPLPHPSPLNAVWHKRFPEMMERRLRQLEWTG